MCLHCPIPIPTPIAIPIAMKSTKATLGINSNGDSYDDADAK